MAVVIAVPQATMTVSPSTRPASSAERGIGSDRNRSKKP
jgi:hypothetical protein